MPRLVVVIGATGVGKTARAIELAKEYQCPIISADSRQIYRDLPIGTAAPTQEEQQAVKHYLVGFKALDESYNAGQFARDAEALLQTLFKEFETVVLVGGSMMYVDALCKGLDDMPEVPNDIRTKVREEYQQKGLEWLQAEVQQLDPNYWQEVDQQNPQRLMHCVEICRASGQTYSHFRKNGKPNQNAQRRDFDIEYILVERPREELYDRINKRVDMMIEEGLLQEAQHAFKMLNIPLDGSITLDYSTIPNSVNTVGYKELLRYFRGEWTLEKAIEMIKQNSRHYAKRQMTWWRSQLTKNDL
jgi:tRNA dimethylallyltransferase